jgi:hypothetical protein
MRPKDAASSSFDCFDIDQKERDAMTRSSTVSTGEPRLYAALELSKNSWLLAIQVPGRDNPSLHPIKGGDAAGLMGKLDAARDRMAKVVGRADIGDTSEAAGMRQIGLPAANHLRSRSSVAADRDRPAQPPSFHPRREPHKIEWQHPIEAILVSLRCDRVRAHLDEPDRDSTLPRRQLRDLYRHTTIGSDMARPGDQHGRAHPLS